MELYKNFIGLDIGKFNFVVATHGNKSIKEYENNLTGIKLFLKDYKALLPTSLSVLETTGGYERKLLSSLCNKNFVVHRANTRKVKNFIRSFGSKAKTDALDAQALALYGYERQHTLPPFVQEDKKLLDLQALMYRRNDLKQMIVAEKNRLQAPDTTIVKKSCKAVLKVLEKQVEEIDGQIAAIVESDEILKIKKKTLKTIPGIGNVIANELLAFMPELGKMNRREAASLAGVAPMSNDSGKFAGYRRTGHGRASIKPILFIAAMAARNSKSELKTFYENLVARGKKKMVALVALMRKILVIANARLKPLANY